MNIYYLGCQERVITPLLQTTASSRQKEYIYLEKLKNNKKNQCRFSGVSVIPKIYIKNERKHMY